MIVQLRKCICVNTIVFCVLKLKLKLTFSFFSDVKFFDAGDYLCNATNKFGWESKSGSLIVKEHTRYQFNTK